MEPNMQIQKMIECLPELLNEWGMSEEELYSIALQWINNGIISYIELWDWIQLGYADAEEVRELKDEGFEVSEMETYVNDTLLSEFDGKVSFVIKEFGKRIDLELLMVEEGYRQQGYGTTFLSLLCALADATHKTIHLFPTSEFGSDFDRLVAFYERFGFIIDEEKRGVWNGAKATSLTRINR